MLKCSRNNVFLAFSRTDFSSGKDCLAVQAAGHLHINVQAQNMDMLSLSAHKFHGPKGIGALYVKKGIPLTTLIEGGAQERGKRAGTENSKFRRFPLSAESCRFHY